MNESFDDKAGVATKEDERQLTEYVVLRMVTVTEDQLDALKGKIVFVPLGMTEARDRTQAVKQLARKESGFYKAPPRSGWKTVDHAVEHVETVTTRETDDEF